MKSVRSVLLLCVLMLTFAALFSSKAEASAKLLLPAKGASCAPWNSVSSASFPSYGVLSGVAAVSANDVWLVGADADENGSGFTAAIEHWNGSTWSRVASPRIAGAIRASLSDVAAVSSNDIWAVGYTQDASYNESPLVEHWNGSAWQVVALPALSGEAGFHAVAAISANDVWAVGAFTAGGADQRGLAEHWNGSRWTSVAVPGSVVGFHDIAALSANNVWAVAQSATEVLNWNGKSWSDVQASPVTTAEGTQSLSGITAITANDIWAVGTFSLNDGTFRGVTEHWNGVSWTSVSNPAVNIGAEFMAVGAAATNDVWAVGESRISYINSSGKRKLSVQPLIEHWDGASWSVVAGPSSVATTRGAFFVAVAPVPGTSQVWALGSLPKNTYVAPFVSYSGGC